MTVLWPGDEELFATARRELFVAVVPQAVVSQAFALALEKVRGETAVLQALQGT